MIYNVDPLGSAVREDNIKLRWTAALPEWVELFDLSADPGEAVNLADQNPGLENTLQDRIEALAREMAPTMILMAAIKVTCGAAPIAADSSTLFSRSED